MSIKIGSLSSYFIVATVSAVIAVGAASYFEYRTLVEPGNRAVEAGRVTIAELKDANTKLSTDLDATKASATELTSRLRDRQRVINDINKSVGQLGSGLESGIATIDQVIESIQNVIDILQHG
jgi:methyl-accepting chemotaxis protein